MWIAFAFGSALFAGLTAILAKCGIKNINYTTGDGFAHEVVEVR